MVRCPPPDALASLLIDPPADGPEAQAVRRHVRDCLACQARLDTITDDDELVLWAETLRSAQGGGTGDSEQGLHHLLLTLHAEITPWGLRPAGWGADCLGFLEPPARPGDIGQLDGYRVRSVLGRGGMGIVLLGFDEALQREVALKVLRPELADGPARERFVSEARAAARVRHDHVIGVYGVTNPEVGPPYCVLEYLAGPSLAEQVRLDGPLPARRAAAIALQVACGLQAAHAAGLVHRDVKPSNVLFDPSTGRAKIADFGLARPVAISNGPRHAAGLAGTPAYMAPEQIQGDDVGPIADLYGMGAMLFETLTGLPPFVGPTHRVLHQVIHREPPSPRALDAAIARDLDTICLKCLQKDPRHRYGDAAALIADLRRFLDGEPIAARPVSRAERALRWARRRPAVATLGASSLILTAAIVVLGVTAGARLRRANARAEANFQRAFVSVNRLLERLDEDDPGSDPMRRTLLIEARGFLGSLLDDPGHADDPAVRREIASAHRHLAHLHDILGEPEQAELEYRQGARRLEELIRESPDRSVDRRNLALTRVELGRSLSRRYRGDQVAAEFRAARGLLVPLEATDPAARRLLARLECDLADRAQPGQEAEAERQIRRAVGVFEREAAVDPSVRADLAHALYRLGVLRTRFHAAEPADACFRRSLAIWETLHRERPDTRSIRHGLGSSLNALGTLYAYTRPSEAAPLLDRALAVREDLARQYPQAPTVRDDLALAHHSLGTMHFNARRFAEAAAAFERSLEIRDGLIRGGLDLAHQRRLTAETCQNLALAYQGLGQSGRALPLYDRAIATIEALRAASPDEPGLAGLLAIIHTNAGLQLVGAGRAVQGLARYDRAVALASSVAGESPGADKARLVLRNAHGARAEAKQALGRFDEAAADWDRVVELVEPADRDGYALRAASDRVRAGRHAEAISAVDSLASRDDLPGVILYNAARVESLAAQAVAVDPRLAQESRAQIAGHYADAAMRLLRRARLAGHFASGPRLLRDAPDLDALRARADFAALIGDVIFDSMPFAH